MGRHRRAVLMSSPSDTNHVLQACRDAGFTLSGVAVAAPSVRSDEQARWLAEGLHGSMAWMEGHDALRADVRNVLEGAVSVICVADRYAGGEPDPELDGRGRIARYARGRDYHEYMKRRLHAVSDRLAASNPGHRFRACVYVPASDLDFRPSSAANMLLNFHHSYTGSMSG